DGAGNFHRLANAVQRGDALDCIGVELGVGKNRFRSVGIDERWCYRVDIDVVLAPFDSQAFGQVRYAGLRHAVDGFRRQRGESSLRAHVDDAPVFLLDHDAAGGLTGEECAFQIDGQRVVEIFFQDVFGKVVRSNACVVHKNVEPSKVLRSLTDRV